MNDRMTESGEATGVISARLPLPTYFLCRTESLPWSGVFFLQQVRQYNHINSILHITVAQYST
jgi:hypothetical protein